MTETDGLIRCVWCRSTPAYVLYHDEEWGFPATRFTANDVERLLGDAGIVRHRGKIESTINNARQACAMVDKFGSLSGYFWRFEPASHSLRSRTISPELKALSTDLKKRGWSFAGPVTIDAFMQAMGLVNDHAVECFVRGQAEQARQVLGGLSSKVGAS